MSRVGFSGQPLGTDVSVGSGAWSSVACNADRCAIVYTDGPNVSARRVKASDGTFIDAQAIAVHSATLSGPPVIAADTEPAPAMRTFLVVFPSGGSIIARRLRSDMGSVVSATVIAATSATDVRVASDGRQFFVSWVDGGRVRGTLVDAVSGLPTLSAPLDIAPGAELRSATFDGSSFLVFWHTATELRGGRVTPAGAKLDGDGFVVGAIGSARVAAAGGAPFGRTLAVYQVEEWRGRRRRGRGARQAAPQARAGARRARQAARPVRRAVRPVPREKPAPRQAEAAVARVEARGPRRRPAARLVPAARDRRARLAPPATEEDAGARSAAAVQSSAARSPRSECSSCCAGVALDVDGPSRAVREAVRDPVWPQPRSRASLRDLQTWGGHPWPGLHVSVVVVDPQLAIEVPEALPEIRRHGDTERKQLDAGDFEGCARLSGPGELSKIRKLVVRQPRVGPTKDFHDLRFDLNRVHAAKS